MTERLERLRGRLQEERLDALLVTSVPNRRYLSGFTGSAGALLITGEHALLLSDFRYESQGRLEAPRFDFRLLSTEAPLAVQLPELTRELRIERLGFEADHLTVAEFDKMRSQLDQVEAAVTWVPSADLVDGLRQIKDPAELRALRRAIAITDEAFAAVRPLLRPEMRERDVAWELEKAMRERGAEGVAFEIIVAGGDNGSRPHARAGDSQLGVGRPIVMDFGARVDGYHADMTRTLVLGEADERFWSVYNTVLEAQQAAESAIRPRMTGAQADALARDLIRSAGYGEAFGHSLGHGVGLEIHEGPGLRSTSQEPLASGVPVTVEPGIYLPGWGGVRIEDIVLLREGGAEVLTQSSKEPLVQLP